MADLHRRYTDEHAPYKKPSSARQDARNWRRHVLPALGGHAIDDVTTSDVVALHARIGQRSRVTANHVRALISKAMNLAIAWGWRTKANPCSGVPRFRIGQREAMLSAEQLGDMDAAITRLLAERRIDAPVARLVRLLALTGCRLSEVMLARREWVDEARRLLVLPDSKTGQRRIALSERALALVREAEGEWLIPGRRPGRPMNRPYAAWAIIKHEAGLPPALRIHDLRHSAGSLGHMAGLSQRQIADMLGHRDLATTARYLHGAVGGQHQAADTVGAIVASKWRQ